MAFIDYYRADYDPPLSIHIEGRTPLPDNYHFYFVFLRENLVGVSGYEVSIDCIGGVQCQTDIIYIVLEGG